MPRVGNKEFGYDAKGRAAAREEARKTGKEVENKGGPGRRPNKETSKLMRGLKD